MEGQLNPPINNNDGRQENTSENTNTTRPKLMRDYFMPLANDPISSIDPPTVASQNFEIKLVLVNMVLQQQFRGLAHEDLHLHLSIFLRICETIKINRVTDDAIKLSLEKWLIVQTFYDGLTPTARLSIDASAGGVIMNKQPDDAYNLIEEIALNQHYWNSECEKPNTTPGMNQAKSGKIRKMADFKKI
ncbi:uncharacterized protein LOC144553842 [Carex rostrata]